MSVARAQQEIDSSEFCEWVALHGLELKEQQALLDKERGMVRLSGKNGKGIMDALNARRSD